MTEEEKQRAAEQKLRLEGAFKVIEWMRVREQEGMDGSYDSASLRLELHHSSLIYWLCAGYEALPEPPPVSMSRPNHPAGHCGNFSPFSVHLWPHDGGRLIIDQSEWKILETKGPDSWIAAYRMSRGENPQWSSPWSVYRRENDGWYAERLPVISESRS